MTRRVFCTGLLGGLAASYRGLGTAQRSGGLDYLALETQSGRLTESWPAGTRETASFGSLLKPFLVIAYLRTHEVYPVVECRGTVSGCWLQKGHGRQTLVPALANSCNSYFLTISRAVDRAALSSTCLDYGLAEPTAESTARDLIGLDTGWRQTPVAVFEAFHRLVQTRSNRAVSLVLDGMRLCARSGTARDVGVDCFAKTGTAPCHHHPAAAGDGYAAILYPVDSPRLILLATKHGTTGAHTAALAGEQMRASFHVTGRISSQ